MNPFEGLKPTAFEALREVESIRNQLRQLLDTAKTHLEQRYCFQARRCRRPSNTDDLRSWELITDGVSVIPRFEMTSSGIFAVVVVAAPGNGTAKLKLEEGLISIADSGFGNFESRQNIMELVDHRFLELDAASQRIGLLAWFDAMLERLVDSQLIQRC